jgi:hypothetical protein
MAELAPAMILMVPVGTIEVSVAFRNLQPERCPIWKCPSMLGKTHRGALSFGRDKSHDLTRKHIRFVAAVRKHSIGCKAPQSP